jgi:acyl-coenzyme A thioesterase PaaI-like protein
LYLIIIIMAVKMMGTIREELLGTYPFHFLLPLLDTNCEWIDQQSTSEASTSFRLAHTTSRQTTTTTTTTTTTQRKRNIHLQQQYCYKSFRVRVGLCSCAVSTIPRPFIIIIHRPAAAWISSIPPVEEQQEDCRLYGGNGGNGRDHDGAVTGPIVDEIHTKLRGSRAQDQYGTSIRPAMIPNTSDFVVTISKIIMTRLSEGGIMKNAAAVRQHVDIVDMIDDKNEETLHPESWELMIVPDRGKLHSHVIFGTLLAGQHLQPNNDLVERYEVYRCTSSTGSTTTPAGSSTTTTTTPSTTRVRAVVELGGKLNGHPGVIHGGLLALLIDDVLGFGFKAAGVDMAMTANLNINYLAPVPANTTILINAYLDRREGRKLYWQVLVTNNNAAVVADDDDDDPHNTVVYCNATSLYIIPRQHA